MLTREEAISEVSFYRVGRDDAMQATLPNMYCIIHKIYDDFESRTCKNCKHKDGEIVSSIHCAYFEQYLPVEIGKCDKWDSKDD